MPRNRDEGFCCGGGGGKIWMEEHHEQICHLRMDEAIGVEAHTVITACPYCLIMMEDAIKDKEKSESMKAFDISEVVARRDLAQDEVRNAKMRGWIHPSPHLFFRFGLFFER